MKPFTREQFAQEIVGEMKKACRCASPAFQKIISFNFEDYGIAPTLLWDSEILIQEIIHSEFDAIDEWGRRQGDSVRRYRCRICARICTETYTDFSINMYRSFVIFDDDLRSSEAKYVLGFRGFEEKGFERITDFSKSEDIDGYLASLIHDNSEH
jgi:hypothetical protein